MVNKRRPKVLVVDDTTENIDILMSALSDDYAVVVARNGAKALQMAERGPDLILLDVMMPEMDGYEVCQRLKANPATRDIPVIFLTALDSITDENRGLSLGAVDYLTKPFHIEQVKVRVANHIQLKRHQDDVWPASRRAPANSS